MLLWHMVDDPRLSRDRSDLIGMPQNRKFFSIASLWEIAIKASLGKLHLRQPLNQLVPQEILLIPIRMEHLLQLQELPLHHRDPFD